MTKQLLENLQASMSLDLLAFLPELILCSTLFWSNWLQKSSNERKNSAAILSFVRIRSLVLSSRIDTISTRKIQRKSPNGPTVWRTLYPFAGDQRYTLAQAPPISIARSLAFRRSVSRKGLTACS